MDNIRLNSLFTFSVEPYNGKLRFVVNEQGCEAVCRIERKKIMEEFLQANNTSIFKGRLQLHKIDQQINIEVKGDVIGCVHLT